MSVRKTNNIEGFQLILNNSLLIEQYTDYQVYALSKLN